MIGRLARATLAMAALAALVCTTAARADAPIALELNKLEPITQGGPGCRVYFVVSNPDAKAIDQLQLDLILFGTDGVIARRLAFDLSPLPPKKTAVRLFDLTGLACDGIEHLLVNDVLACHRAGDETVTPPSCLERLSLSAKTKVPLMK
jgi:hypothetical protein